MKNLLLLFLFFSLAGCLGYQKNITPVKDFELEKYLGTWYEIARLDHSFERGLEKVQAVYTLRNDGGVSVLNRGFSPENNKWSEATGRAYFVREKDEGYLKVSFFGPFYGSYVIFWLDKEDYQHAFITGPDNSYLWYLSRSPVKNQQMIEFFLKKSAELGISKDDLIFVNHD